MLLDHFPLESHLFSANEFQGKTGSRSMVGGASASRKSGARLRIPQPAHTGTAPSFVFARSLLLSRIGDPPFALYLIAHPEWLRWIAPSAIIFSSHVLLRSLPSAGMQSSKGESHHHSQVKLPPSNMLCADERNVFEEQRKDKEWFDPTNAHSSPHGRFGSVPLIVRFDRRARCSQSIRHDLAP